jgi:PAS domain S-box-containing protein
MERKLGENDFIVSKTDTKGRITYCNQIFMDLAEYTEEELLGKPHNLVRHEEMPRAVFKLLWDRVEGGEEIFAYVVNKTKNGNYYWVYANVTPSYDDQGKIIGYYSVRRKPNEKALEIIRPLYAKMLDAEKHGGMEASAKLLNDALYEQGASYDEFIIHIQK